MNPEMQSFLIVEQIKLCEESWFNIFQESLSYEEKHQILFTKCDNQYKVDDGAQVTAVSRPIIPNTHHHRYHQN